MTSLFPTGNHLPCLLTMDPIKGLNLKEAKVFEKATCRKD